MGTTYFVKKKTTTYSDMLEAYGLANLVKKILVDRNVSRPKVSVKDNSSCFEVVTNIDITDEMVNQINFFYLFRYIIKDYNTIPNNIRKEDCYDYPKNKEIKDRRRADEAEIRNNINLNVEQKKQQLQNVRIRYESTPDLKIDDEFDVYNELKKNSYQYFEKKYELLHCVDIKIFRVLIKEVLRHYSLEDRSNETKDELANNEIIIKDDSSAQIINPNHAQGVFKKKSNGLNRENPPTLWIEELMKISGALDCNCMICKQISVSQKFDLKVYVPKINESEISWITNFITEFKTNLKSNTPIRIDILNILHLSKKFIEKNPQYVGNIHNTIKGLYLVGQKQLNSDKTKPKTILNISFLSLPNFIVISNEDDAFNWIDILNDQILIISNVCKKTDGKNIEDGSIVYGLTLYRNFISGSDLGSFFDFSFWYAAYLSSKLSNKQYAKSFIIESLNKFYNCMDTQNLKLMEIIENKGFQAIAKAIRESTVNLQINASLKKKGKANDFQNKQLSAYTIRYGVAQTLQTKSKSTEDLAAFIGEFISLYNAETARYAEKNGELLRSNVREDELCEFFTLLDKYSSRLVGALLASYGFALKAKDVQSQNDDNNDDLMDNTDEE